MAIQKFKGPDGCEIKNKKGLGFILLYFKWVPCHYGRASPEVGDGEATVGMSTVTKFWSPDKLSTCLYT
jgi:hypothetical protein